MSYNIEWSGVPQRDLEPAIRADVDEWMDGDPRGLITHTMMVGGEPLGTTGPSVSMSWDDGRGCLVAEYSPVTKWVTLNEMGEFD